MSIKSGGKKKLEKFNNNYLKEILHQNGIMKVKILIEVSKEN